jgi:hypothetical protein
MTLATFLFSTQPGGGSLEYLAWAQSALLLVIVVMLVYRTLTGLIKGEICREEIVVDPSSRIDNAADSTLLNEVKR